MPSNALPSVAADDLLRELRSIRVGVDRITEALERDGVLTSPSRPDSWAAPSAERRATPAEEAAPAVAGAVTSGTYPQAPGQPQAAPDHGQAQPAPSWGGQPAPAGYPTATYYPSQVGPNAYPAFPPPPPPNRGEPFLSRLVARRSSGLRWFTPERVLGVAGSLVTLVGIVFMLVLGVRYGWFGPVPRVVSLAALSLLLGLAAVKVHRRTASGAVALAATSVSAAFLVIVAATSIYEWVPSVVGVLAAMAVAVGGFLWAARWNSQLLGSLSLLEVAVAIPAVTGFDTAFQVNLSCLFVLAASVALAVIAARALWPVTARIALGTALFFSLFPLVGGYMEPGLDSSFAVALAFGLVLAAVSLLADEDICFGLSLLVVLLVMASMDRQFEAVLPVALCLAGVLGSRALTGRRRHLLIAFAAVAGIQATALGAGSDLRGTGFAAGALALALAGRRASSALLTVLSWVWALIAMLFIVVPGAEVTLSMFDAGSATWKLVLSALLLTIAAVIDMGSSTRVGPLRRVNRVMVGLIVALICSGVALVSICSITLGIFEGFRLGHVLTTGVWVVTGVVLLLRRSQLRVMGFALAAVAVAKLFFFDLVTIDGWLRVVLFLAGGLMLLAAAAAYRAREKENAVLDGPERPEDPAAQESPQPREAEEPQEQEPHKPSATPPPAP